MAVLESAENSYPLPELSEQPLQGAETSPSKLGHLANRAGQLAVAGVEEAKLRLITNAVKLSAIHTALKKDAKEHPALTYGSVISAGIINGFEELRGPFILFPSLVLELFKNTNSPELTGTTVGAGVALYLGSVGAFTSEGLYRGSHTVNVANKMSRMVKRVTDTFRQGLPGISNPEENSQDEDKKGAVRQAVGSTATSVGMGFVGATVGPGPYALAAHQEGFSRKQMHKFNAKVSFKAGMVIAGVVEGFGHVILLVKQSNPLLAQSLEQDMGNRDYWVALAASGMALKIMSEKPNVKKAGGAVWEELKASWHGEPLEQTTEGTNTIRDIQTQAA